MEIYDVRKFYLGIVSYLSCKKLPMTILRDVCDTKLTCRLVDRNNKTCPEFENFQPHTLH